MHQRKKNEETTRHPRNSWRLQKVYEISGESNLQRRKYSSQKKKKTTKENASHLEKELPMTLLNSTKDFTRTTWKMIQNMKWMMMTTTATLTCTTTIPKRRQEVQRLRQKSCKPQSTNSKKGESPDSKGIRGEDIKDFDEETREMVRQVFNEITKREMNSRLKTGRKWWWKWYTRKETWKMWETTARFAHCPRCTNCSRQFCTEDYTQWLTRNKQKIRLASENPNRNATSGESKCGLTNQYRTPSNLATSITITSASWRRYTDTKSHLYRHEESNIFVIRKGTKQGDPLSSLLFNTVLQYSLKDEIQPWQKRKGIGIYLSDHDHDCLTNPRFADDVLLFATSKEQLRKMLCQFKKSTEKWDSEFIQLRRKFSATRASWTRTQKRNLKWKTWKSKYWPEMKAWNVLGQKISINQQETTEIKRRIRAVWATFHKYRQQLTSKNYMLKHRLRLFDAIVSPTVCYAAGTWAPNQDICWIIDCASSMPQFLRLCYAAGTWTLSKEHERKIQSTQRKMLRLIIQTKGNR